MTDQFTLDEDQESAAHLILTEPFGIVTGGPGVGKTTTLRTALARIHNGRAASMVYVLLAPTGKAARRITETTGEEAMTVHRWLGMRRGGEDGTDEKKVVAAPDFIIVDEASMLSVDIAAWLFRSLPKSTRVILVGDVDQLPSVGAGQVLSDIIKSGVAPVVRLTTVHRSAQGSWVCDNAYRIIKGQALDLKKRDDFEFVKLSGDLETARTQVVKKVSQLTKAGEVVQVLGPYNKHALGVDILNADLQEDLNPKPSGEDSFRIYRDDIHYDIMRDDRVIYTANDYKLGVFNGQEGKVLAVNPDSVLVDFDGTEVAMDGTQAAKLRLAYALTIHKSQGSEWDWVLVICHDAHSNMLCRQILYTAVTRAKKGVILMGTTAGIHEALTNDDPRERVTTLMHRLLEG